MGKPQVHLRYDNTVAGFKRTVEALAEGQRNCHPDRRPPKVMKNGSCSASTLPGSAALPFVISTEAQRNGEICGLVVLSWKCFSTGTP
jgi:hypothetical protein